MRYKIKECVGGYSACERGEAALADRRRLAACKSNSMGFLEFPGGRSVIESLLFSFSLSLSLSWTIPLCLCVIICT